MSPLSAHMLEINKNWTGKPFSNELVRFESDDDRIQSHLLNVHQYLTTNTPKGFSAEALKNRSELLAILKNYAEAKRFPRNTGHSERTPYFIDRYNTACAVGYLVIESGYNDFAQQIKKDFNFNYITDMPQAPLEAWAKKHGFEVWELAWIQPAYAYFPPTRFAQRNYQLMSEVNKIEYIADLNLTCYATMGENIYTSSLFCLTNTDAIFDYGVYFSSSPVYDFEYAFNGKMVAGGAFDWNDSISGLAFITAPNEISRWANPVTNHYITKAIALEGNVMYFTAEYNQGNTSVYKWIEGEANPTELLQVIGPINTLEAVNGTLYVGGNFDSYNDFATINACNNILAWHNDSIELMGDGFVGEVHQIKWTNGHLFAVGQCTTQDSSSVGSCAIEWQNGAWSNLISDTSNIYFTPINGDPYISDIMYYGDTLLISGNSYAYVSDPWQWSSLLGRGLSKIDENNIPIGYGYLQGSVNSMTVNGSGKLEVGGDFQSYTYGLPNAPDIFNATEPLYFSGEIAYGLVGVEETALNQIQVYPNPSSEFVTIQAQSNIESLKLFTLDGKLVRTESSINSNLIKFDLVGIPSGAYVIEVQTLQGSIIGQFILK